MEVREWSRVGDGGTAEIFTDDQGRIVKLFREWFGKESVDNEYRKSEWAYAQGLPAAKPLGRARYGGREAILLARIEGESLLQRLQREPETAEAAAGEFAAYHVRLNALGADNLDDSQRERLIERIGRAELLSEDERRTVLAELRRLPDDGRLCHGDFHPGNVMENEEGWRVIDWIDACCGHPLYDAARTLLLLGFGTEAGGPRGSMAHAAEIFRGVYLKSYAEQSGFSEAEIERWMLPVAAARLIEPIPEAEKVKLLGLVRHRLERLSGEEREDGSAEQEESNE
ncbi:phosphotransferase [Saccharibacillus alkalitolerans]|uniref:Phosphotransferase n=1 Tax=Saccharibacillus alkalitolerans TaxID=2705290 RepID=A0ABX0F842_9BACL|nr:phosphotransferase [Saccharibacillus alkalitolerans]NGZ75674.1 phosphotransferase [Saccharibacillus alkalitolerans]